MKVNYQYSLKNIDPNILGFHISSLTFKKARINISKPSTLTNISDFIIYLNKVNSRRSLIYRFSPESGKTITGSFMGFTIEQLKTQKRPDELGYQLYIHLMPHEYLVERILGYGHIQKDIIVDPSIIKKWYKNSPPNININVKNMNLVAIQFVSKKWMYAVCQNEKQFDIYLDETDAPKPFIEKNIKKELKIKLCLLETIE